MNIIKESFHLTNKYIILAVPPVLFSLFSGFYIMFSLRGSTSGILIAFVLFLSMLAAFLAGWFYMIKICIAETEKDADSLLGEFPAGVGEYFLPAAGMVLNIFVIAAVIFTAAYLAGMKFIGDIGISAEALSKAMESSASLMALMTSLDSGQLFRLNAWNFLIFAAISLNWFLVMFYPPALFWGSKNPFKAYFVSIKNLFGRKFFGNAVLFLSILVCCCALSLFAAVCGGNIMLHFLCSIINFYYLIFATVLVFCFYYRNFVKTGASFDKII